jgi:hypothetical protein
VTKQRGGQTSNANARKHGGYSRSTAKAAGPRKASISELIDNLIKRQEEILKYATTSAAEGNIDTAIKAMSIYGQNSSRMARMLKIATGHLEPSSIEETLRAALDEAQVGLDEELKRDGQRAGEPAPG